MAEGRVPPIPPPDEPKEDPDFYIRTIAATWGHLDLIKEWIPHHRDDPAKITDHVLIPAAMYGQLEVLEFALEQGDPLKKDSAREYAGWNLMHFAVDGAQRNMIYDTGEAEAQEEVSVYGSPNEIISGTPPLRQPKTNEEVKWRQMDIIYFLAQHGVPVTEKDSTGQSPSDKAIMLDEIDFTEGAMLLDILALMNSGNQTRDHESRIETPGLSRIPTDPEWKAAILHVVEWAYHRRKHDILKFCHQRKYATLSSPQLILSSPQLVQKNYQLPILIDAVRREDFEFIKLVVGLSRNPTSVFNQPFEWQYGSGKRRETLLSYACSKFLQVDGGNQQILLTMLSPQGIGKSLTQIVLVGVGLRQLPAVILHENLRILDIQENNLSSYPTEDTTGSSLSWKCQELEVFNFSHNLFTYIHPDIFHLPCLLRLNASHNNIQEVPKELWTAPRLRHLDLSHNKLQMLPCPPSINMANSIDIPQHVARSFSFRSRLPGINSSRVGYLQSTRRTYINFDIQSSSDLHKSQVGFGLHTLDLSSNQLMAVPRGLACLAPLLNSLKLNNNRITDLGCVSDYPPGLKTLDVSCNGVVQGIQMSGLDSFACVQSQLTNAPSSCSHLSHQRMNYLLFLYLSSNRLEDLSVHFPKQEISFESTIPGQEEQEEEEKVELIFPHLQGLRLSNNRLCRLPENIHLLEKLSELTFDGNPGIRQLPPNLHLLTKLFTIKYEGISDPIVMELRNFKSAPDILYYLKARATQAYLNRSMRLLVIGHYHKGKSTLLGNLTGKPPDSSFDRRAKRIRNESQSRPLSLAERKSTVGIECGKWECGLKRRGAPKDAPKITFYTWDFAGQEEYYVTHQCFLTNRGLYLLVWNVKDGLPGIESLNIWLQNLQARAHGFSHTVIIVGTHIDELPRFEKEQRIRGFKDILERYRIGRMTSRGYPIIKDICFVGCPLRGRPMDIDTLNDVIYKTAMEMESPNDGEGSLNLRIKTLEEKIPSSYDQLRQRIERLAMESRTQLTPPIIGKDLFCELVQEIIKDPAEIEAAVDFLYATTGVVLHFKIPVIKDYYIIDPQRWFDLCSLVISPDNVSSLVRAAGRPGDERFGLLSTTKMDEEFHMQRCDHSVSKLIRTFLNELHIIHQVNRDYCLVPSAIESDPVLASQAEYGSFPRAAVYQIQRMDSDSFPTIGPMVVNSYDKHHLQVRETGLVYRRMLLLPPIASGFWSKLIALFLQKADFQQIIKAATPGELALHPSGPSHRLRSMIGNLELAWIYWKTGIVLYVGEKVVLRVNSLQESEFSDPQTSLDTRDSVYSTRRNKLRLFHYQGEGGWQSVPNHFKEVIEVVVPEVYIERSFNSAASGDADPPLDLSAKILAKALEIIDEVLKNHCEHLAVTGIYTLNDMLHVIPCAICYGDRDERPQDDDNIDDSLINSESVHPHEALLPHLLQNRVHLSQRHGLGEAVDVHDRSYPTVESSLTDSLRGDAIHVFTVDVCIKQTFTADYVLCPKHGAMEIQYLAPDLVFADLVDVKIEKHQLNDLVRKGDRPEARGAFGAVFKRTLRNKEGDSLEVAVKLFEQLDDLLPNTAAELTRSYSDMRFELNKLSTLSHPYIVKFIGVLTNPHSFVLEWAPLKSLEHIRQQHAKEKEPFCPMSIAKVLMQVTSALAYLHSPTEVGIVHRDLKNGNILVFRFPEIDHVCFADEPGGNGNCDVFVKLTDMGVCANPLAYNAKALGGLRQFVPECVTNKASWSLTEKVDIFSLGSCLYELMTLRGLPPSDIGEPEYKNMLLSGKRAQFYAKDPLYPLLFFQFLEDCWHQEHFKRPSAASLCRAVLKLSGSFDMSSKTEQPKERGELQGVLLDSYTLHQGHRISASQTVVNQDTYTMCVALSSPDDYSTTIAITKYNVEDPRTELQAEHVGQIKEGGVTAVHATVTGEVLIGCDDGKLIHYDKERTKSISDPSCVCMGGVEHGGIVKIHYDHLSKLLIIGFDHGRIHMKKCIQGLRNSLFGGTQWRECCCTLHNSQSLFALECLSIWGSGGEPVSPSSPPNLEVWCGTNSHEIEVWSLKVAHSATWSTETVDQVRKVQQVPVNVVTENGDVSVKLMSLSDDETRMAVVLATPSTPIIAIMDVEVKQCLRLIPFNQSVASVLISSSKLAIGTYDGEVYVHDSMKLLEGSEPIQCHVATLKAHIRTVYSLVSLKTRISPDGFTSTFPTFLGKAQENYEQELLVSTGYGRGYPELRGESKAFVSFYQQGGCYVNTWLL